MTYPEMNAELAENFYHWIKALTDREADLSSQGMRDLVQWMVEMFLMLEPFERKGKTATEILAEEGE